METNAFKSVTFGGFAKQDVIDYIEQAARTAAAVQEKLQQENEGLRTEAASLASQLEELKAQNEMLQREYDRIQAELERESAQRRELEPLCQEVQRLTEETERLRPDAAAYAQFRERIGAIECEARKRAADLEEATMATLRQVVDSFRIQYQSLMSTFDSTAAYVTGELRKVEVGLAQLPRAMDRPGTDLKELEASLAKAKEKIDA